MNEMDSPQLKTQSLYVSGGCPTKVKVAVGATLVVFSPQKDDYTCPGEW
jgi:hypothetical protein